MNLSPDQPSTGKDLPQWSESLRDGTHVLIRPLGRQDRSAERTFIEQLSPTARRFRFLGQMRCPSERLIEQLTDLDYVHEVAFAAVLADDPGQRLIGVSRYSTDDGGSNCECAVTVTDEWQNRGLGTLLMRHLIEVARTRGIRHMTSIDSAQNLQMKELAHHLGFRTRPDPDDAHQVLHELDLEEGPGEPGPAH